MNSFRITLIALALGLTAVACGGSDTPPKDPSADAAATLPAAPETTPDPPPAPSAAPSQPAPAAP